MSILNCCPGVVNLSDKILSHAELSLLSKGLIFVDTPDPPDLGILSEDLSKFHLSIKRHLAIDKFTTTNHTTGNPPDTMPMDKPELPFSNPKFRNPSKWNPPAPLIVEHMALLNQEHIVNTKFPRKNSKFNLTKDEHSAKHSLARNKNIVIKKADKGSAGVVQNRSDYLKECLRN